MSLRRIRAAWREGGARRASGVVADRTRDFLWGKYFGVDTTGLIPIETLITDWQGCHDYFPSSQRAFHRLMRHVDIEPGEDVFVDVGSGKGRAMLLAAQYPFRRIVGLEISETLNRVARRNIERWRGGLSCRNFDIRTCDAGRSPLPEDGTVFYFYNPFHGPALKGVFEAIQALHAHSRRRLWVLFNNTRHFRELERRHPWLRPIERPVFEHECAVYLAMPTTEIAGSATDKGRVTAR